MAEGMSFSFPSLLFHEGRTYGQPDLLMPQEALFARGAHSMQTAMRRALLRRGRSGNAAFSKTESNVAGNLCRIRQKGGIQTWRFFITQSK